MQSCRIAQLEQRAAERALARDGAARRLPRAGDELAAEATESAVPAECVTAIGVSMFCSRWSGQWQIVPSATLPASRQNDAFRRSGALSNVTPASVNLFMDCYGV
jgi:hypothetical protein